MQVCLFSVAAGCILEWKKVPKNIYCCIINTKSQVERNAENHPFYTNVLSSYARIDVSSCVDCVSVKDEVLF